MKAKDKMIAMQDDQGMGHMGKIILTTQARVDGNLPFIADNIVHRDYAIDILRAYNSHPALLKACKEVKAEVVRSLGIDEWLARFPNMEAAIALAGEGEG